MVGTPEYAVWDGVVQRVTNPNGRESQHYFHKGIDMDPRWLSFENFYADMGDRPEGKSIERVDNDKGYWSWNCVWATSEEQNNNTSRNRRVTFNGVEMNMTRACRAAGINAGTVYKRLKMGFSMDDALTKPVDMKFSRQK